MKSPGVERAVRRPCARRRAARRPGRAAARTRSAGRRSRAGGSRARVWSKTASVRRVELGLLGGLLRERLHDVDADDVLLGDRGDVGHLLLHVAQHRVRDVAVAVGEATRTGVTASAISASRQSKKKSTTVTDDDGEHVLEEEDQPVAEEEADALEVDGRARHQLAGLVAVVEAEREADEVRVEPLRRSISTPSACRPEIRRRPAISAAFATPRADDRRSAARAGACRRAAIALSITSPVSQRSAICAGLRADRKDDRDDERDPVRPQEAEQPPEGRAVRGGSATFESSVTRLPDAPSSSRTSASAPSSARPVRRRR